MATIIKFNEIFELEIVLKEPDKLCLENMLRDNDYKYHCNESHIQKKLWFFTVYNVGITECCIIRKLIRDKKITVY